jgi:FHA domain
MPGESLEVTDGPARGEQQDLNDELVIGRSADGFGTLKGDPEISRRHAQISRTDEGRLYISDLGSTNGTFVNGNKIEGSAWLSPGDVVKVGQSTMKIGGGAADSGATRIAPSPTSAPTRAGQSAPPTGEAPPSSGPPAPAPIPVPAPSPPPAPSATPAAAATGGPGPGAPPPGQRPAPTGGGGGGNRMVLIIVGAIVALLVIVGVVLAATGTFSSSSSKPKPPPLTLPSTSTPSVPSVPTESTPTATTQNTADKAKYIIGFDRVQRSYAKLVAALIRKARHPSSVEDIITAFKRLKTLYGSTATRIGNLETPGEIRGVSRTYTATLRVSSAGVNLIIACARARSESCYKRRLASLSSRTRRIRKKFSRAFRARGYPVAVLAPS